MEKSISENVPVFTEIEGYIKREITDIARKCHVDNLEIIKVFKKIYDENKIYK